MHTFLDPKSVIKINNTSHDNATKVSYTRNIELSQSHTVQDSQRQRQLYTSNEATKTVTHVIMNFEFIE